MKTLMLRDSWKSFKSAGLMIAAGLVLSPFAASAQTAPDGDRWLHVRVISTDSKGESVCVNVPIELAEKILPAIDKNQLHGGKVTIDKLDAEGVDFRALLDAVRSSKDGEFVTVNGKDGDVRVAKQGGFLLVHVTDGAGHSGHHHQADKDSADKDQNGKKQGESSGNGSAAGNVSHVEVKIPLS